MMLFLSGVNYESMVDGEGIRATFFISGCLHNCKDCHNPETHNFENGFPITKRVILTINEELKKRPFLSGITLSGGDPFFQASEVLDFVKQINHSRKDIWVYSGFTYEELIQNNKQLQLLEYCNILVDGRYTSELKDTSLRYRGSKNQRIIDIQKSLNEDALVLWRSGIDC